MKSKVMSRPMFMDVENVGIMQGFKDEDMGDEGYETGAMMNRLPDSPEILMNNLRGDMRSVDARVEELASLVGDDVAMETPPEVLALLQPVLAAQEGIASLPAGMPPQTMASPPPPPAMGDTMPAPDMGMMPPDMGMMPPPEMGAMPPPRMPAEPINMAQGGYVQSFRNGSDEEGVTPSKNSPPVDPYSAQALLQQLEARRDPEALRRGYEELMPLYQEALGGGDKSGTQSQILFDIAQAGLNLAAGTDSQGRRVPAGASFATSLASAAQGLPERIGQRVGQLEQQEQGTRLAALKGAQQETTSQRDLENRVLTDVFSADRSLRDQQRLAASSAAASAQAADLAFQQQVLLQTLKAQQALDLERAKKGLEPLKLPTNWQYATAIELAVPFGEGKTTPEQDEQFLASATVLMRGSTERSFDEKGKPVTRTIPGIRIPSVIKALKDRGLYDAVINGEFDIETPPPIVPEPVLREVVNAQGDPSKVSQASVDYLKQNVGPIIDANTAPTTEADDTLWKSHSKAIGIFRQLGVVAGGVIPFDSAGRFSANVKQNTAVIDQLKTQFAKLFRATTKLAEGERDEINQFLKLAPRFFQNEVDYRNNLIGLTRSLDAIMRTAMLRTQDPNVTQEVKNEMDDKIGEVKALQDLLGAPMIVRTQADFAKMAQLPIGTEVLLFDPETNTLVLDKVRTRQ